MKKYEYREVYEKAGTSITEKLNQLGQNGWKVVASRGAGESTHTVLMREIKKEIILEKQLAELKEKLEKVLKETK